MAYSYTPTYYSSLHDSISSICKNILPFSLKKKRLPAIAVAEQRLSKQQSDNLKSQQESFHQILNLMGLCKEGIIQENVVSSFRTHLLQTLLDSPIDYEPPLILRDKLIFLQELLYAKCISEDEYHKSKMPLLQKLAVQGAEIRERDVIVEPQKQILNKEWPVNDLMEEKCLVNSEVLISKNKLKEGSTIKKIKGNSSALDFVVRDKNVKLEDKDASDSGMYSIRPGHQNLSVASFSANEVMFSTENPFWNQRLDVKESESKSILTMETLSEASIVAEQSGSAKGKRKPFRALFQRDQKEGPEDRGNEYDQAPEDNKKIKKSWGFDGFKKWKKSNSEDETAPLSLNEKSDGGRYTDETRIVTKKLHRNDSMADSFPDEVLGENIKKELSRIQTELRARTTYVHLSGHQIEESSTQKFFQKSWGEQGDCVLEKHNSKGWTTFDDEENSHPNLFAPQHSYSPKQASLSSSRNARTSFNSSSIDKGFNPFFDM